MKTKRIIQFLLILSLFLITSIYQAQSISNSSFGVSVGSQANYKVEKNEFYFPSDKLYFQYLFSFLNVSDIPVTEHFNVSTIYDAVKVFSDVVEGTVIGTTVKTLPSDQSPGGSLEYTYNGSNWDVATGFILGTPVVSTDWNEWSTFINNLPTFENTNHTVTATVSSDNADFFNSTFSLGFSTLPQNITYDGVEKLTFDVNTIYNKTTGVLESENFILEMKSVIKTLEQVMTITKTNEAPGTNVRASTAGVPGFDLVSLLPVFVVIPIYYLRKRVQRD